MIANRPDKDDTDSDDEGSQREAKRRQQVPALIGLSAFLPPGAVDGADFIEVEVSWADYVLINDSLFAQQLDRRWMSLVQGGSSCALDAL
ncbi:MAG: hypothetical protein QM784_04155 [Polyangiaceae bacterium]